jgi:hypothetical protein
MCNKLQPTLFSVATIRFMRLSDFKPLSCVHWDGNSVCLKVSCWPLHLRYWVCRAGRPWRGHACHVDDTFSTWAHCFRRRTGTVPVIRISQGTMHRQHASNVSLPCISVITHTATAQHLSVTAAAQSCYCCSILKKTQKCSALKRKPNMAQGNTHEPHEAQAASRPATAAMLQCATGCPRLLLLLCTGCCPLLLLLLASCCCWLGHGWRPGGPDAGVEQLVCLAHPVLALPLVPGTHRKSKQSPGVSDNRHSLVHMWTCMHARTPAAMPSRLCNRRAMCWCASKLAGERTVQETH